ncbi:MAG: ATP-binding protein [Pyrinomonadaceae bacterium]
MWVSLVLAWVAGGAGIGMGYHRLLTHRGYKVPKAVEYILTVCGTLALEGGPINWVATHRIHHAHTDVEGDPHTPRDGGWWAHIGWILLGTGQQYPQSVLERYAPDLCKDRFHVFINTYYYVPVVALGLALFAAGGWPLVMWGMFLRTTLGLHGTWLVNSATHMWGSRRFETKDDSRNNWWVALLSFGEGWYNNHHAHPTAARHGLKWYEIDFNWYGIRTLQLLGLAKNIKLVKARRQQSAAQRKGRSRTPRNSSSFFWRFCVLGITYLNTEKHRREGTERAQRQTSQPESLIPASRHGTRFRLKCAACESAAGASQSSFSLRSGRAWSSFFRALHRLGSLNWRQAALLVLGIIFFSAIIAGLVLNTTFLVREIRLNEQHDGFINAVTHELKTPLASIRLYIETLKTREVSEAQRQQFYDVMLADSDRLLHTVEQVLRAGEMRHRRRAAPHTNSPINVSDLVRDCLELARVRYPQLAPHSLRYSETLDAARGAMVMGDYDELRAAVSNLIDNAVKYSDQEIDVAVEVMTPDERRVAVRVTDRGIGIPREQLKRIYKRFYRVPQVVMTRFKGTGLGLFSVRSVVKKHGGRTFAESAGVGQGSTFTIILPRSAG